MLIKLFIFMNGIKVSHNKVPIIDFIEVCPLE